MADHFKDEVSVIKEKSHLDQSKLKREIEFMVNEQHTKELQILDVKSKLAKRTEEL
jgi:DnaJ-domain-containing protein 1